MLKAEGRRNCKEARTQGLIYTPELFSTSIIVEGPPGKEDSNPWVSSGVGVAIMFEACGTSLS
jgi:hypothetical protein